MVTARLLGQVVELSRQAGVAAMEHYGTGEYEEKGDRSPVTAADRAAHRVIAEGLASIHPGAPVVSEEGEVPPYDVRRGWSSFWLVDPLDGTKEFLQRNGQFTVNIALIEGGVPVLGVVYAPAIDVLYSAAAGAGTWKHANGAPPERLLGPACPGADGAVIVESRSHPSPELESYLRTLRVAGRIQVGSSLKFGLLAEGAAHLYPRFGPTHEWDVAAGDCVWRNSIAEGQRPSPLAYNTPTLKNAGFVVGMTP